jgi:hypothetical protein
VTLEGARCSGFIWLEDFFGRAGEAEDAPRAWDGFLWGNRLVMGCEVQQCE